MTAVCWATDLSLQEALSQHPQVYTDEQQTWCMVFYKEQVNHDNMQTLQWNMASEYHQGPAKSFLAI